MFIICFVAWWLRHKACSTPHPVFVTLVSAAGTSATHRHTVVVTAISVPELV